MNSVVDQFMGYSVAQHYGRSRQYRQKIDKAIRHASGITTTELDDIRHHTLAVAERIAFRILLIGMIGREDHRLIYQDMQDALDTLTLLTGERAGINTKAEVIALAERCRDLGAGE